MISLVPKSEEVYPHRSMDKVWPDACIEAVCVDASGSMNDLADRLLRGGSDTNPQTWSGSTFFKQFLPLSDRLKYDLVICSQSLFELPDMKARLRTIDILWRKTDKYLVLVEAGTNAGYRLVQEARDYILQLSERARAYGEPHPEGHVFSPCPHDKFCPRFFDGTYIPCNFEVSYGPFAFGKKLSSQSNPYTYVVMKQGRRTADAMEDYPRLIQEPLLRTRHVVCRTCTKYGTLKELTVTKKRHGSDCYRVCKKSHWGDLLPVALPEPVDNGEVME